MILWSHTLVVTERYNVMLSGWKGIPFKNIPFDRVVLEQTSAI
jgi:hypothetical protein